MNICLHSETFSEASSTQELFYACMKVAISQFGIGTVVHVCVYTHKRPLPTMAKIVFRVLRPLSQLCFYCYDKTPWPKAPWDRKYVFQFIVLHHSPLWKKVRAGTQDRDLEARTDAEAWRAAASSSLPLLSDCTPGLAAQGRHSELSPLTSMVNNKNAHRQIPWDIFSVEVPSSDSSLYQVD